MANNLASALVQVVEEAARVIPTEPQPGEGTADMATLARARRSRTTRRLRCVYSAATGPVLNSMETFVLAYFQALTCYTAHLFAPERLITELMRGTRAMNANDGDGPTNEEAFAAVFHPALGHRPEELRLPYRRS